MPNQATTKSLVAEDNQLTNKYDVTNETKTLAAKEFMDKVIDGEITLIKETEENFRQLFVSLGIV